MPIAVERVPQISELLRTADLLDGEHVRRELADHPRQLGELRLISLLVGLPVLVGGANSHPGSATTCGGLSTSASGADRERDGQLDRVRGLKLVLVMRTPSMRSAR